MLRGKSASENRFVEPLESRVLMAATPNDPAVIDVMIVYTSAARIAAGGHAAIRSVIDQSIAQTNQAFENSEVFASLRLVHSAQISYAESGSQTTDIARLRNANDGYIDSVHSLRDDHGADLVSLFTDTSDGTGYGYILTDFNSSVGGADGFTVVDQAYATRDNYFVFAHEIGHNLGANHDHDNAVANAGAYDDSYGHRFFAQGEQYRDIMAYFPGEAILYYSNPDVNYKGTPTGQAGYANVAWTLNNTTPFVADYREAVATGDNVAPSGSLDADTLTTWTESRYRFKVTWTDDVAIDVSSFDSTDIGVFGPNGYSTYAKLVDVNVNTDGKVRRATYSIAAPDSAWSANNNGTYTFATQEDAVHDTAGNAAPFVTLGTFTVNIDDAQVRTGGIAGTGDFDGNGSPDIVLRNPQTGHNTVWRMNGTSYIDYKALPRRTNLNWTLAAVADFGGPGNAPDLVWRNSETGANQIWVMDGYDTSKVVDLKDVPSKKWKLVAAGDLNDDGHSDIVWRHSTGENAVWLMNKQTAEKSVELQPMANSDWKLAGLGDFDGDGDLDIVWNNKETGASRAWRMNPRKLVRTGTTDLPDAAGSWRIAAVGSYQNDTADLLLFNSKTGGLRYWLFEDDELIEKITVV